MKDTWYCHLCFQKAVDFGEIFPMHTLILHENIYKIVKDHDEIIRFPSKPSRDPYEGMSDDEIDDCSKELGESYDKYMQYEEDFRKDFRFHPERGHEIVELCKRAGWDKGKHDWLCYWIIAQAEKMIREKESQ